MELINLFQLEEVLLVVGHHFVQHSIFTLKVLQLLVALQNLNLKLQELIINNLQSTFKINLYFRHTTKKTSVLFSLT